MEARRGQFPTRSTKFKKVKEMIKNFFKNMFGKKEVLFKNLPLLKDGLLKVNFKYCNLIQDPETKDYIPNYKKDFIYSNKISEFILPNSQNNISYRVYDKDGNFIQLNYGSNVLKDSLYFERKFSYKLDENISLNMFSKSEIDITDPETGEKYSYIRDIDNDSYVPDTKEGATDLPLIEIEEFFKAEDKKLYPKFMIFYRNIKSDFDELEDILLYIEVRGDDIVFYDAYLIDCSNISFNI